MDHRHPIQRIDSDFAAHVRHHIANIDTAKLRHLHLRHDASGVRPRLRLIVFKDMKALQRTTAIHPSEELGVFHKFQLENPAIYRFIRAVATAHHCHPGTRQESDRPVA